MGEYEFGKVFLHFPWPFPHLAGVIISELPLTVPVSIIQLTINSGTLLAVLTVLIVLSVCIRDWIVNIYFFNIF